MNLQEFKNQILNKTFSRDFIILVSEENYFIADQYIETICNKYNCKANLITSLAELENSNESLIFDYQADDIINILKVDTFTEVFSDYSIFKNCIISCSKVSKDLETVLAPFTVIIPKLVDWQVKAYIKACCPGLESEDQTVSWLYEVCKKDIYKIQTELDKIKLFPISQQLDILNSLRFELHSYLYTQTDYTLKNALKANNRIDLYDYLIHREYCKVDPYYLINQLIRDFKNVYFVNYTNISFKDLGITDKQYYAIKRSAPPEYFLLSSLKFLTDLEIKLKTGQVLLNNDNLIDYIICNILNNYEH